MTIPYEKAAAGGRALQQLQRDLEKFGCQSFGHMIDGEKGATIVQFRWHGRTISLEASWKGYCTALLKSRPSMNRDKALDQAKISVCSVLRDWVKGQMTAIECGVMSFDEAFMPHILLSDGRRVIDKVVADKLLSAPDHKVVDIKR